MMQACFVLRFSSNIQAFSAALLPLIADSDRPGIAGSSPLTASCDPARKTQEPHLSDNSRKKSPREAI